jgi:flagellar hook-length control protein FliK
VLPQTQQAFERALPNPVAALNRPTLQSTEPAPMPRPITTAPVGLGIKPADISEADATAPQVQSLSETLSEPPRMHLDVVRDTQVMSPLDHCEVAPLAPHLVAEPLRTTFAAIERHFANVIPAAPKQPAEVWQPTPIVNSTVATVESIKTEFHQADTQRELVLPPSLQTDLAAFEASPTATLTSAPSARATVTRVVMTPATTAPVKAATDLTDEWLGERQITDPSVSSTEAESVGTLTPNPVATAPDAAPDATRQPESAGPTTYFSTNVTHAAWATNIVTEQLPAVWNPLKPAAHSAGTARWTAALNHVAGPASQSTAHETSKVAFPWVALNTTLAEAPTLTDKVPKPERSSAPSVDATIAQSVTTSIEANVEAASTRPLERVVSPLPGLIGSSSLPGAPSELALPRVALEHERAVERPLPPEPLATSAAQPGAESALPTFAARTTPTANGTELDLQLAGRKAVQEDKEGLAVKGLDAAAPLPLEQKLERGTAVAQSADTRDTHVSHVARQLAEPLISASAGLAPNEPRTIRLKLRPETLGEVEIVLTHDASGQYHARMIAEREQTTHVLRGQLGQLREALEQAGLQVGQLDITTSTGSPEHHRQGGQGWHAGGQDSQHAHPSAARIPETESFDHEPATYSGPTTAHNGLLNLHA